MYINKDMVKGMATERPFGVTILAILEVIGGILSLAAGAFMLFAAAAFGMMIPGEMPGGISGFVGLMMGLFSVIGIVVITIGLISFIIAYGLWNGRGWAWTLCLIFSIIGIIIGILSLPTGIISLIINILILYYLTRPHVKAFFGKGPSVEAPPPPPP